MQIEGGGRVLLVDDEPIIVRVIERALRCRCVMESATDGAIALERLRRGDRFALVLCDLQLPTLDGLRLLDVIRREMPEVAAHFVIMTGGATSPAAQARLARAGVPVFLKPFGAAELVALVDAYLPPSAPTAGVADRWVDPSPRSEAA